MNIKIVGPILIVLCALASSGKALSAIDKPSALSPVGQVSETNPTFVFSAIDNSTWFQIWVNHSGEGSPYRKWVIRTDELCRNGKCYISVTDLNVTGAATWWVRGWNSTDKNGPWSNASRYSLPEAPLARPELLSPEQSTEYSYASEIQFSWGYDTRATWYQVWISDSNGIRHRQWYKLGGDNNLYCDEYSNECYLTLENNFADGEVRWWVRGYTTINGLWSSVGKFTTANPDPTPIFVGAPVTATISQGSTHRYIASDISTVELQTLSGDADIRMPCSSTNSGTQIDSCEDIGEGEQIIEIYGYAASSTYTLTVLEYPSECFPDFIDSPSFKYLSALYESPLEKQLALSPRLDNVCEDTIYYQTVDPLNKKDTLDKWLRTHGFITEGSPQVTTQIDRQFLTTDVLNAEYHNLYDLGFGRDMYCKKDGELDDTFPCVVQNYNVANDLTAAENRPAFLVVSVAMEFTKSCVYNVFGLATSQDDGRCGATAFYVFDDQGRRINSVDLDNTGRKSVPETCIACHDGTWDQAARKATRGEYLPFDGALFGDFYREWDTTFSYYTPSNFPAPSLDYRDINKLLRPILPGRGGVSSSSGEVAHPGIRRINASGVDDNFHDNYGGFNAGVVLDTFCRTCHISQIGGDYFIADTRENELGTNCQLCHNRQSGGGSKSILAGHLCNSTTSPSNQTMPNAKITHLALYNATIGKAPYSSEDARLFVQSLCGVGGMQAP